MSEPSFAAVEAVAEILREYGSAAIDEMETGVPIYEGDFAQRILTLPHLRKDWEAPLRDYVEALDEMASDLAKRCRNCGRPIHAIERKQVVFHPTMPSFTEWDHGTGGHWCDGDSSERATPRTDATLDRIRADLRALLAPEVTK